MAERSDRVRREILVLVGLVVLVDVLFVGGYFAGGIVRASSAVKLGFTAAWTLITMVVVLRGLSRIRSIRERPDV